MKDMHGDRDEQLWEDLCAADHRYHEAQMALVQRAGDLDQVINRALDRPEERGAALRVMNILPEARIRLHMQQLAGLASFGHSDIGLVRSILTEKLERRRLVENIDRHVESILETATDQEKFRRIAELYQQLDLDLLKAHLARCAAHANEEVREVASDFAPQPRDEGEM